MMTDLQSPHDFTDGMAPCCTRVQAGVTGLGHLHDFEAYNLYSPGKAQEFDFFSVRPSALKDSEEQLESLFNAPLEFDFQRMLRANKKECMDELDFFLSCKDKSESDYFGLESAS